MNTMSYTQAQLEARQQEGVEARQKALNEDASVQSARRTLEKATSDYEQLQSYVKGLKLEQRLGYNGNVAQAKDAVTAAEKALREVTNAHYRRDHLSKLQEQRAGQQQQREAEQAQFSQEQEAALKRAYKPSYLASGGKEADYDKDWDATIWPAMKIARANAHMVATQRSLKQAHAYTL